MVITGALLIAAGLLAIAGSVQLHEDAFDLNQKPGNRRWGDHDGIAFAEGVGLDVLGLAGVVVGAVLVPVGLKLRAVEVPAAPVPSPGTGAKLGVALAF
ncbi:MAG: hypothetical protein QM765_26530 [Myxococcales bacterium]